MYLVLSHCSMHSTFHQRNQPHHLNRNSTLQTPQGLCSPPFTARRVALFRNLVLAIREASPNRTFLRRLLFSLGRSVGPRQAFTHHVRLLAIHPFRHPSLHDIGTMLDKRCQVDTLYLDFSKAFDVDHKPLLTKLQRFGITGNLLRWLNDYLTDRKQRVTSQALPILSGVPQGSILGPLLFLIYVNALPASVSTQSTTALFTDGTKCYRAVRTTEDGAELQCDLMNLIGWCNTWRMDFNVSKCGVLSFTRSHKPICYPYEHLGTKIKRPDTMKDLGITITGDLK